MLKKHWPRLVLYKMQRRQTTCSLTIMLMLGSKYETPKSLNLLRTSSIWVQASAFIDSLQQNKKSVDLKAATKIRLLKAIVESVLLNGSEKWTVTKKLEKSVNRCYTRML